MTPPCDPAPGPSPDPVPDPVGSASGSGPTASPSAGPPVLRARGVRVVERGAVLLDHVDVEVAARHHLVVLGPNGSGKTTLLRVLATFRHPTAGTVEVLGHRLGRVDVRRLRPRVGLASVALDPLLAPVAVDRLVAGSVTGTTFPPPSVLADADAVAAARRALSRVGADHLTDRRVDTLSQGERQRVRIARALASDPDLLLLDEPFAGLDLGGRERLLADLDRLMVAVDGPTVVLVTHHLEEIPTAVREALLLVAGRTAAAGPVEEVLTATQVGGAFGVDVRVTRASSGRWAAVGEAAVDR